MNKYKSIFATAIFLLVSCSIVAQINEKFKTAEDLLNKYLIASKFEENGQFTINEHTRKDFTELFSKDATIIFDIPFANKASAKSSLKRYGGQERHQFPIIAVFGKEMSPEMYVATLDKVKESQITIYVLPTGKNDITKIDSLGIVIFEIEKSFQEKDSLTNPAKYLLEIDVSGHKPLITGIRKNEESFLKRNVIIHLFNDSRAVTNANTFTCMINMEYPERINNTMDTMQSVYGKIRLEQVANRATIKIKKANDREAIEYEIPNEWRDKGKKVSEQPEDGFEVNLMPRLWKGWSYTIDIHGGLAQPIQNNTANFSNDSKFTNDPGYRIGAEFLVSKYFNPKKWKKSGWLFGVGIGATISYHHMVIKSEGFIQNKYNFKDVFDYNCEIEYQGSSFVETNTRTDIALPLYADFRIRLNRKSIVTLQPGINVSFPIQTSYSTNGTFSRWGYYPKLNNNQPIKADSVYNYYTNQVRSYEGEGSNSFDLEGQLRINFLFNIFKKNPDNALSIGLIGTFPMLKNDNYQYEQTNVQTYEGYWINTENDQYHSLMCSKSQPYNIFIGLSIGINLVKYKTK